MSDNGMIANFMAGVALADREQAERVNIPQAAIERARPYAAERVEYEISVGRGDWVPETPNIIREGLADKIELVQAFAKAIADEQERCARVADDAAATITDLTAQLDKAREALRPFAVMGRMLDGPFAPALFKDADPIGVGGAWSENGETRTITFGDLRRAARACLPATSGDVRGVR